MAVCEITNLSKSPLPNTEGSFATITTEIMGPDYELSLVFTDNQLSQELNRTRRNKDYPTNILSFPLDDKTGEIFIDLELCNTQCAEFDRTYENFVHFLFIHGLLHLKGYDHGSTMESEEERYRAIFGV